MAVFTTLTKQKLSWVAPEIPASSLEVDFLFSDASDYLFSDDTDYLFKEAVGARVETSWTPTERQKLSFIAPVRTSSGAPEIDYIFSDSTDFLFSDSTDYVFREETSERILTSWTLPSKQRLSWQS